MSHNIQEDTVAVSDCFSTPPIRIPPCTVTHKDMYVCYVTIEVRHGGDINLLTQSKPRGNHLKL